MYWNAEETKHSDAITKAIEDCTCPRQLVPDRRVIVLDYNDAKPLLRDLSCYPRGLICRQLCKEFAFDRPIALARRLEHKLIQSLVFRRYVAEAIPKTTGLLRHCEHRRQQDAATFTDYLKGLTNSGGYIKRALSHGSGETGRTCTVEEVLDCIKYGEEEGHDRQLDKETFVLQEQIDVCREYRVHSVEGRVLPDLTCARYARDPVSTEAERHTVNSFIQGLLNLLPNPLVYRTIYGWDIAQTSHGAFYIVEANIAGFHSVFKPGFHFSGFFMARSAGPIFLAKLMRSLENIYDVRIQVVGNPTASEEAASPYRKTAKWRRALRGGAISERTVTLRLPHRFAAEYGETF